MADELTGKRIAFLATNGVEQIELTQPLEAVREAGAEVDILSLEEGEFQAHEHLEKGEKFTADKAVADAEATDYDGLVLPGGVANPDFLRADADAVRFVRAFVEQDKPVGAICHGPWTLVEAGVVNGRTLTSWPSIQTDIRNAGGTWVDEEVHVDQGLVTSRNPDDLDAFCAKIVEEFAEGEHGAAGRGIRRRRGAGLMRVVVTGATGNVGTSVLEALVRDDSVDSILAPRAGGPGRVRELLTGVGGTSR